MNQEAMQAFLNYSWPGNVSELINVIERFVIMVPDDEIRASHLSLLVEPREFQYDAESNQNKTLRQATEHFEREYIHQILMKHQWDLDRAAADLEIEKESLDKKIKNYGITFLG